MENKVEILSTSPKIVLITKEGEENNPVLLYTLYNKRIIMVNTAYNDQRLLMNKDITDESIMEAMFAKTLFDILSARSIDEVSECNIDLKDFKNTNETAKEIYIISKYFLEDYNLV